MEVFLGRLIDYVASVDGQADVDLIDHVSLGDHAAEAFDRLRAKASARFPVRNWLPQRTDPFMAFDIDLGDERERAAFAALAHRTINAEARIGGRIVLHTVESEELVYVDLAAVVVHRLVAEAGSAGAATLRVELDGE